MAVFVVSRRTTSTIRALHCLHNRRASWRVFIYTCNITGVTTISPVQGSTAGVCVKNECQAASVRVTCNCPEREVELE